jgi:methylmalonyl-CoA mutase N-terminal domain/subunit
MGGSEYIEGLTNDIERGVGEYLKRIEEMGGTLRAIETGYIQNEIQNAAYSWQRAVESGERVVVGVNRFQQEDGRGAAAFRVDPAGERAQVERLRALRASRNPRAVTETLSSLERAAAGGENLMPPILEAAKASATLGEIADAMRRVFGEYQE